MTRNIYILLVFCLCSLGSLQAQFSLSGQFLTTTGTASGNVDIELQDADGNTISTQHIDCGATYTIDGLEAGVDYTLHLKKELDTNPLNGFSTFDLVLISNYILGTGELSFFATIATDVDGDGIATIMDLILLRRLILAIDTEFSNLENWVFVKEGNDFASATYDIQLTEDVTDYNFTIVRRGDVNNSHTADCE